MRFKVFLDFLLSCTYSLANSTAVGFCGALLCFQSYVQKLCPESRAEAGLSGDNWPDIPGPVSMPAPPNSAQTPSDRQDEINGNLRLKILNLL